MEANLSINLPPGKLLLTLIQVFFVDADQIIKRGQFGSSRLEKIQFFKYSCIYKNPKKTFHLNLEQSWARFIEIALPDLNDKSGSGFEELLDPNCFGDQGGISIWSKNWN